MSEYKREALAGLANTLNEIYQGVDPDQVIWDVATVLAEAEKLSAPESVRKTLWDCQPRIQKAFEMILAAAEEIDALTKAPDP
jgi:hypothetical protein